MAREVIVSTWCDRCLDSDIKEPGRTRSDLRLDGVRGELDLCDDCWDIIAGPLRDLIIEASQPVEMPDEDKLACPMCDKRMVARQGVQSHLATFHDAQLAELEAEAGFTLDGRPIVAWCPDCPAGYGDRRGAVGHRRYTGHGKPIDHPPGQETAQPTLSA